MRKNKIYPYDFQITDDKYLDTEGNLLYGVWECEWVSKKAIFDFNDINYFIISKQAKKYLGKRKLNNLLNLLNKHNISCKLIDFENLPKPTNQFLVERYLKRIKN